jgi:hypothetical protein
LGVSLKLWDNLSLIGMSPFSGINDILYYSEYSDCVECVEFSYYESSESSKISLLKVILVMFSMSFRD